MPIIFTHKKKKKKKIFTIYCCVWLEDTTGAYKWLNREMSNSDCSRQNIFRQYHCQNGGAVKCFDCLLWKFQRPTSSSDLFPRLFKGKTSQVLADCIYEMKKRKPVIRITTLLFSKNGEGSCMCNIP